MTDMEDPSAHSKRFRGHILQCFSFLPEQGFKALEPSGEVVNLYALCFEHQRNQVRVEGINWGMNAAVTLQPALLPENTFELADVCEVLRLSPPATRGLSQDQQVQMLGRFMQQQLGNIFRQPLAFWEKLQDLQNTRMHNLQDPTPEAFRQLCQQMLAPLLQAVQLTETLQEADPLALQMELDGFELLPNVDFQAENPCWQLKLESSWGTLYAHAHHLKTGTSVSLLELAQKLQPGLDWEESSAVPRLPLYRNWLAQAVPLWLQSRFWE